MRGVIFHLRVIKAFRLIGSASGGRVEEACNRPIIRWHCYSFRFSREEARERGLGANATVATTSAVLCQMRSALAWLWNH